MLTPQAKKEVHQFSPMSFGSLPKKSILKKTNSFTFKGFSPLAGHNSPVNTPYSTITGSDSRIRSAFDAIFRKSATLQDVTPDPEMGSLGNHSLAETGSIPLTASISKKVKLPRERVCDMSLEDQRTWELEEMAKVIGKNIRQFFRTFHVMVHLMF